MSDLLTTLRTSYTLQVVAAGAALLGAISGALGSFAVLRKQSLLGDALSHAALPGIALAFIITGSKSFTVLILGAALAGWAATLVINTVSGTTKIKYDTSLGLVLSVFFGVGLVLLGVIQNVIRSADQAGLDTFLFGQAAALLKGDVIIIALIGAVMFILLLINWKQFKTVCFDPDFARSLGLPVTALNALLTTMLVVSIMIGLQTVGVVLMSAMLVAPGAAARQWTDRLGVMVPLAALFGAVSGAGGALISSMGRNLATGPLIIINMSVLVGVSLFFAPNRGLLFRWGRQLINRRRVKVNAVLEDMAEIYRQHGTINHSHSIEVLRSMSQGHGGADGSLRELVRRGYAVLDERQRWRLTDAGLAAAETRENAS